MRKRLFLSAIVSLVDLALFRLTLALAGALTIAGQNLDNNDLLLAQA